MSDQHKLKLMLIRSPYLNKVSMLIPRKNYAPLTFGRKDSLGKIIKYDAIIISYA